MRIVHFLLGFSSLLLFSCLKEFSLENQQLQNPDTLLATGLLEKMISVTQPGNTDSLIQEFRYDDAGRLVRENTTAKYLDGSGSLITRRSQALYERDANHRIFRITRIGVFSDLSNNIDTLIENVIYEGAGSSRIVSLGDSNTVFEYDANNRVVKTMTYQRFPTPADPLKLVVFHQYSYDAVGNMTKREEFNDQDNNGSFELGITYSFEYDGHINPFHPTDDALIEWTWTRISPANVLKQKNDVADPQGIDDENVTVYEYGSDNKPRAALFVGNGLNIRIHYYYK
jgi:YD repeat-containing protein